jgi:hypothetical protein
VTVFTGPCDRIDRESLEVMQATCADVLAEIQELWPRFERRVGLRGRKMYATADLVAGTYSACTPVKNGDDPEGLGLSRGHLPAGRFLRGRLHGEPSETYALIAPGFDELEAAAGDVDRTRPLVEFYKRHDEIELWLPLAD